MGCTAVIGVGDGSALNQGAPLTYVNGGGLSYFFGSEILAKVIFLGL